MYSMEIHLFGQTLRVEVIVACVILGYILGGYLLCSCSRITITEGLDILGGLKNKFKKEGFSMIGAPINYKLGADIPQSWENNQQSHDEISYSNPNQWYKGLEGNIAPEPKQYIDSGRLDILADNTFKPSCCPSFYSSSNGCACISPEQMKYMNQRGGNRTFPTEF